MGKPTPCQWNTPLRCQGAAAWRTPVHPRVCVNGGTELDHRCGLVWRAFRGGPRCWQDLSPLTISVEKRPAVSAFAESRPVEPTLPRLRGVISWSLVRCRGPCPVGFWGVANSIEHCCNFGDELVAQSRASLVDQSAALRTSARASGCSSRRTSLFEFLQDLGPRGLPAGGLNSTFSDLSRTPLQLGRPCRGDFIVRLLQTGKQFLRDTSAVNASEAQGLGKQLVRRHDVILAFAPENGLCSVGCRSTAFFGSVERFGLVKASPSGPHAPVEDGLFSLA